MTTRRCSPSGSVMPRERPTPTWRSPRNPAVLAGEDGKNKGRGAVRNSPPRWKPRPSPPGKGRTSSRASRRSPPWNRVGRKRPPRAGSKVPLQTFERLAAGKKPAASVLEAFARYLSIDGRRHPSRSQGARFARRAAEIAADGDAAAPRRPALRGSQPAARMGGSAGGARRHGRRDSTCSSREAQLARDGTQLARRRADLRAGARDRSRRRQRHARPGRALHRGGPQAHRADDAGARGGARAHSVALLRVYAAQLRALGRDTEAAEVEGRYAALRFDDSAFLSQQVELAVARRDTPSAERWLERFLRSEPDSSWSRCLAARTYRALGQSERALAAYQRALALAPEDVGTLRALSRPLRRGGQARRAAQAAPADPRRSRRRRRTCASTSSTSSRPKPRADEAYAWAPERVPAACATAAPTSATPAHAARPHGDHGVPQRPRQPLPPGGVPAAHRRGRRRRRASTPSRTRRDTRDGQLRARQGLPRRRQGRRGDRERRGRRQQPGDRHVHLDAHASTSTSRGSTPATWSSSATASRTWPPRNEFADYFGEVEYLRLRRAGRAAPSTCSITPKARTFYFNAPSVARPQARGRRTKGDRRSLSLHRRQRRARSRAEPVMPPLGRDRSRHVHVSTYKTWDEVGALVLGPRARTSSTPTTRCAGASRRSPRASPTTPAKVRAIYKYVVQRRATWRSSSASRAIKPRRCAQTFARGWGDCKDKATLIVTMLREARDPRDASCSCARACAATSRPSRRASRPSITPSPTCPRSISTSTAPPSTPARASCRSMDRGARGAHRSTRGKPQARAPARADRGRAASRRKQVDATLGADGGGAARHSTST